MQQIESRKKLLKQLKKAQQEVNKFNEMDKEELPATAYVFLVYDDQNNPPAPIDLPALEENIERLKNIKKTMEDENADNQTKNTI